MQIRPVEPGDVETLKWLGAALQKESPEYRDMRYSPEKVTAFVRQAADKTVNHITGWVAVADHGQVVGFILGYTSTHIFFDDVISWDGTLYLQPEYRGKHGKIVVRLLRHYIDWADQWKGPIKIGLTTGIDTERLEIMLHRLGFETTGKVLNYVWRR